MPNPIPTHPEALRDMHKAIREQESTDKLNRNLQFALEDALDNLKRSRAARAELEQKIKAEKKATRNAHDDRMVVVGLLQEVLDAEDPCLHCDGTGGAGFTVRSFNGTEFTDTAAPSESPCEECCGTGFEIPEGNLRDYFSNGSSDEGGA